MGAGGRAHGEFRNRIANVFGGRESAIFAKIIRNARRLHDHRVLARIFEMRGAGIEGVSDLRENEQQRHPKHSFGREPNSLRNAHL